MAKYIASVLVVSASFIFVAVLFGDRIDPIWLAIAIFSAICTAIAIATFPRGNKS